MKKISLLLVFVLFAGFGFAAKVGVLPEIVKPERILVDGGKVFVTQGIHVYIYALKDLKLVNKLGKEGEGPREFRQSPAPWLPGLRVFLKPGRILINSLATVSQWTREGTFIEERKKENPFHVFMPFEEKYVVHKLIREGDIMYLTFSLYGPDFALEKEVFREENAEQIGKKMDIILMAGIKQIFFRYGDKGKFFIPGLDGIIRVFDKKGNPVGTINPPYTKVPVTSELEDRYDRFFKADIRYRQVYTTQRQRIKYPDYLPLMKDYRVADGKVYVIGSKKENEKYESFIYDLNGKLLKKVWLPLVDADILELFPFTTTGGKIYQLVENEDEEEWELHVTKIE